MLGIDGGGTRTRCALGDADGRVLHLAQAGPVNTNFVPRDDAVRAVRAAVSGVLAQARREGDRCRVVCATLGLAAAETPPLLREAIGDVLPHAAILPVCEGEIILAAACRADAGVAVIAGTGSAAWGRGRDGQTHQVGGWGTLLGDQGSAYALAVAALRAACLAHDEVGEPTALVAMLQEALHLAAFRDLVGRVYRPPLSRAAIAALCPLVFRAAEHGDRMAQTLLDNAAGALARQAVACARHLNLPAAPFPIVASGGVVANAPPRYWETFMRVAGIACPQATCTILAGEPVIGAVRRAAAYLRGPHP